MIFKDRREAGAQLAGLLKEYQGSGQAIIVGLPRGGVVVADEVAKRLHLPLDVICLRKVGAPFNPELALGAVSETGQRLFNEELMEQLGIDEEDLLQSIQKETSNAKKRAALYRGSIPKKDLQDKIVILVDDGLATGATMKVAIQTARDEEAVKIVVGVPVAPFETLQEIKQLADQVVCLSTPSFFQFVGQFYDNFGEVLDAEVLAIFKNTVA